MTDRVPTCDFCGKEAGAVEALIAGPTTFICNECIGICNEVLLEKQIKRALQRIINDKPLRFPNAATDGSPA